LIIGLCGLIGSGKNTAAEHLIDEHAYESISFAETLKDAASSIFGWNRTMLEGATAEARAARETKDEWWSDRLGFDVSPRYMLQFMGTEVMRNNLHNDIWALSVERKLIQQAIERPSQNFVISDVRFPNEVDMIRRLGGRIWHIQRGDLPEWFGKNDPSIHESERAWNNTMFDATIYNNGSIEQMCGTIDVLLDNLLKSW
jgi:hypothetical protein